MKLSLEVFFTKIVEDTVEYLRQQLDMSAEETNPDRLVYNLLAHVSPQLTQNQDGFISHSTSWRYEEPNHITLTYIVYSDHFDLRDEMMQEVLISALTIATAASATSPRPIELDETNVLAHGLRHIAFLVRSDKARYTDSVLPETATRLHQLDEALAGSIH